MNDLILASPPARPFKWWDRHGNITEVRSLETQHLVCIFLMIWHNTAPREYWLFDSPNLYTFPAFYTTDYFRKAVNAVYHELQTRIDLSSDSRALLEQCKNFQFFVKKELQS